MKKSTLLFVVLSTFCLISFAQSSFQVLTTKVQKRCSTMEYMEEAIKKDPTLPEKWRIEGEKQYNAYLLRQLSGRETRSTATEIVIPIVFHLVDVATNLSGITDRDIYEQVEILNRDYNGRKADYYKNVIPPEIYARTGRISVKFVLARRSPTGTLTTGIERRVNTTPDHVSIKANATGGLDAWDVNKYVNVWAGTFSGADAGLLGISTFPFTTGEGPHGVVIGLFTLPLTSPNARSYYPEYDEGSTLTHEIGHYFYLWHTFGDLTTCNNQDFRIQAGWPLPTGAGPEGDDTPEEKAGPGNAYFGNPSMNYSDGCTALPFGMMYGSYMNYFDDRALFMFSDGHRKRVEGCIDLYRSGLKTSDGATPPVAVTDAFMVTVTPRGTPVRREYIINNSPFTARVRNSGTTNLTTVTVNVKLDAAAVVPTVFPLSLAPGRDTVLNLAALTGTAGNHTLTVYTTAPNGGADTFSNNDTLLSYIFINTGTLTVPFTESFTSATFPPTGWQIYNPNANTTWTRNATSGFTTAGSATVQNYSYNGPGQFDDLITPVIDLGTFDSAFVKFNVAHGVYSLTDVSEWDGLEVYVSGDGGITYNLAYKKTGNQLKTITAVQTGSFAALPTQPDRWRTETINLTPYITGTKKLMLKFRNTNAFGNNLYIDDITIAGGNLLRRDAFPLSISAVPNVICTTSITPNVLFGTNGLDTLKTLVFNYRIDNGTVATSNWTGSLTKGQTAQFIIGPITGLQPGTHVLTIYTSNPNGLADQVPSNDTIHLTFSVIGIVSAPVTEGFESTAFPPTNWAIDNPDGLLTWERTTTAAKSGIASAVIRNFDYAVGNTIDKLVSPVVNGTSAFDSIFVAFDLAYKPGVNYPGSTDLPLDTLEIQVTKDCGATFTTVWKKWGFDLETVSTDSNNYAGNRFVPAAADWKNIRLNLTPYVGTSTFQVYFVARSNKQNNLYIDNVNISGKTLPQRLKNQGYLIYPNPFRSTFTIHHFQLPTNLMAAAVYNSVGEKVWDKQYNGQANTETTVDLRKLTPGVYELKLFYTDKTVVERIVKE